jgi:hypothetical protein
MTSTKNVIMITMYIPQFNKLISVFILLSSFEGYFPWNSSSALLLKYLSISSRSFKKH